MYIIVFFFSAMNLTNILALFFQDGGIFGGFGILLPILMMVGIFYFLVILPQKKQKQDLEALITSLKINDEIVTNGGIIGKIKEIRRPVLLYKVRKNLFSKSAKVPSSEKKQKQISEQ